MVVDDYIVDVLMRDLVGHDRKPAAYLVYLYLWRQTRSKNHDKVALSHSSISGASGLSKSAVQRAINWLLKRKLVSVQKDSATAIPYYSVCTPWKRGAIKRKNHGESVRVIPVDKSAK